MSPIEELRHRLNAMAGLAALSGTDETRADLAKYITALDALISERDALREALKPFAEMAERLSVKTMPIGIRSDETMYAVRFGDLRRAHAALSQQTTKS